MDAEAEVFMETEEPRRDIRRANGAPLVRDPENPAKLLRYSRPSGYGKHLDDENALVEWRIFTAMTGVAKSKALQAKILAVEDADKESKKALKSEAMDKGSANERADMGTALHAMTVRVERKDETFEIPGEYAMDLRAYTDLLDDYGLISEMFEAPFVNDLYRAAGTADRLWRLARDLTAPDGTLIEAGTLLIGDLKTGQKLDFNVPGFCVQLALYAGGVLYDVDIERRLPTPEIHQGWGLLVHMPVGKARASLHWISLELGREGARLASEVKSWQNNWKKGTGHFDAPQVELPEASVVEVLQAELGATVIGECSAAEMNGFVAERIKAIGAVPEARKMLMLSWPEGCPSPKQGITDPVDLVKILNVLDDIEKQFSLPFINDPRVSVGPAKTLDRSVERHLIS